MNRPDRLVISTALVSSPPVPLVVPATCSVRIPLVLFPRGRSVSMCGVADEETEAWGWKGGTVQGLSEGWAWLRKGTLAVTSPACSSLPGGPVARCRGAPWRWGAAGPLLLCPRG